MNQSPLNYTGGKYKLLPQILPLFPRRINRFVDLFCGGCNVGINVPAKQYSYNDICSPLIGMYSLMRDIDPTDFLEQVNEIIHKYGLSDTKQYGYDYYNCSSGDGLSAYNKDKYLHLREDFNNLTQRNCHYYVMLYVLIVFSFNNQIRFNRAGAFNLPPGKRDFNSKMREKLITFLDIIHEQDCQFTSIDYSEFDFSSLTNEDFVYADPPYLITCASYNEQNGWGEESEKKLLSLLDSINERGIKFALSNVLESKGIVNNILEEWINNRSDYSLIDLEYSYNNANYQRRNKENKTREILIINY